MEDKIGMYFLCLTVLFCVGGSFEIPVLTICAIFGFTIYGMYHGTWCLINIVIDSLIKGRES
jgi:hypothetical protein